MASVALFSSDISSAGSEGTVGGAKKLKKESILTSLVRALSGDLEPRKRNKNVKLIQPFLHITFFGFDFLDFNGFLGDILAFLPVDRATFASNEKKARLQRDHS